MVNKSRKQKSTRNKTRLDSTKKERRPVKSAQDNRKRIRAKKRTDNQNDTSVEAYSNYTRLLQLFPYLHPVAIDRIFANCNRDFIRTIDNLLYIKRYFYFIQTNDYYPYPHTATTTGPDYVFVHHSNVTENKQNDTNTDCTRTTDVQQDNSNSNDGDDDSGDGYIPNGNIEGVREQIRMYEEQCSLSESVLHCSLNSEVNIFPLSQCNSNFHTSTPQVRLASASASDDGDVDDVTHNVQEDTCYLQLDLTNYNRIIRFIDT